MPTLRACPVCFTYDFESLPIRGPRKAYLAPVVCRSCGLAMINPMYSYAEDYAACESARDLHRPVRSDQPLESAFDREMYKARLCMDLLGEITRPGDDVLEVGAGDGSLVKLLQDHGAKPVGVDMDPEGCRWVEEKFGIPMIAASFEGADFGGRKFDVIASSHVIEHVYEPVEVLRKTRALLKPNGRVFIETPNIFRPKIGPRRLFSRPHKYYFSPRTLALALYEAGFRVTGLREFNRFAFQITAVAAQGAELGPRPMGERWWEVVQAVNRHAVAYYASMQFLWRKVPGVKERMIYRVHRELSASEATAWLARAA